MTAHDGPESPCTAISTPRPVSFPQRGSAGSVVTALRERRRDGIKASVCAIMDNEAARCVNTKRPLTRSLDSTEEGLAMKATRDKCTPYDGPDYQGYALRAWLDIFPSASVLPWTWWTATCGTPNCLTYSHLTCASPLKIAYPSMLCIYCGCPGGTKDHLLPRPITGDFQRRFVATVPACGECNSMLQDFGDYRIRARRAEAHRKLRKKYRRFLEPFVTVEGLEGRLLQLVKADHAKKGYTLARLAWPDDPEFDLRAFQRSGIEDPYAIGVI